MNAILLSTKLTENVSFENKTLLRIITTDWYFTVISFNYNLADELAFECEHENKSKCYQYIPLQVSVKEAEI